MSNDAINLWLNVSTLLVLVGAVTYFSLLRSTTWFGDD